MKRSVFVIAGIILLVCGYFGVSYAREQWPAWEFSWDLDDVVECMSTDNPVRCAEDPVRHMLVSKSGGDIVDAVSTRLDAAECHYVGHVVGQQLFIQHRDIDTAVESCNRECDSACVHGAVGEAFAEELGYDPEVDSAYDLAHLSAEDIKSIGQKLCISSQTCHGVGHTMFQAFRDFQTGVEMCRSVSSEANLTYCVSGYFMEYADILTSKNMRSIADVSFPDMATITTMCDWPASDEMYACFRYFPRIVITTLESTGLSRAEARNELRKICESFPERKRRGCIGGIGVYDSYYVMSDQKAAIRSCERMSTKQDEAACYIGQVAVAPQDRRETLVPYCGTLPSETMQYACYQGFFYFFVRAGGRVDDARKLCETQGVLCTDALSNRDKVPWDELSEIEE